MMILNNIFLFSSLFVVVSGVISFVLFRKHLLSTLLSLEFIMLGIYFFMSCCFIGMSNEIYFVLFFLSLVVCEGALGLSLLVVIVRTHGSDYFSSMSSLEC
uniref:NADH dehydrogenase subunit 4L n=1 Tax=Emerita talpoida TaxID=101207 RepID=UPI00220C90E3|nr:NADH dehydrogenase subunit 4L [Emerita talpoida]UXL87269.1 NADH dehydrogenase subunit 4L [Emerita talpoida]